MSPQILKVSIHLFISIFFLLLFYDNPLFAQLSTSQNMVQQSRTGNSGDLIWSLEFDEIVDHKSPTVVDGVAYIANLYTIYAVDISTGDIIWETELENPIYDSPAVVNDVLYIGDQNRLVYALDITDGTILWTRDEEQSFSLSRALTTVFGDVIYMSTGSDNNLNNGWLRALDAATGEMLWEYETVNSARENSPTVTNEIVYIGDAYGNLYALDSTNGEELWVFESGHNWVKSSATIHDGIVYTVISQVLPDDGTFDVAMYDAYIYALDAETGDEIWTEPIVEHAAQEGATSSPTVYNGRLYVGIYHTLFSINIETADIEWEFETGSFISSSPTVAEDVVYTGSHDYSIYAVDTETGSEIWSLETPYQVRSSPVVVDGVVYIGADQFDAGEPDVIGSDTTRGYLYAIEAGVLGSSQDSRIQLGTINHHFGLNPFFDITVTSTNSPVREEEELEADITVKNLGLAETQTVLLKNFNGEVVDQKEISLDNGESEMMTLRWQTAEGDAAYNDVTVSSDNHSKTETVIVMQDKIIGCEDISKPGYYTFNESVSFNGTCININSSYVELDGEMNTIDGVGLNNVSAINIDGGEEGIEQVTVKNLIIDRYGNGSVVNGAIDITNVNSSTFSNIEVSRSYWGIWAEDAENMHVENSVFRDYGCCHGIYAERSPGGTYHNLEFNNLYQALWLADNSNNSIITESQFQSNFFSMIFGASSNIEVTDNTVLDSSGEFDNIGDFFSRYNSDNIIVTNLRAGKTDHSDMLVSFDPKNAQFMATESPGNHSELTSLQKYFEIKFNSGEQRFNMEIHYGVLDVDYIDEETLGLWFYEEEQSEWMQVEHAVVDESNQSISADLTEEGIYGVFSGEVITPVTREIQPVTFRLEQNYPNPFNPATTIRYALPQTSDVHLEVFNVTGQRVALLVDELQNSGWQEVSFDASSLASGMYIYRIQAGHYIETRQMMLIK